MVGTQRSGPSRQISIRIGDDLHTHLKYWREWTGARNISEVARLMLAGSCIFMDRARKNQNLSMKSKDNKAFNKLMDDYNNPPEITSEEPVMN